MTGTRSAPAARACRQGAQMQSAPWTVRVAALFKQDSPKTKKRVEQDRVAEPIDSAVSSPGAYLALGLLYTIAAVPAIVAPQAAADFLFGAAQPHDTQFEQLFRIFAAGNLSAATASLAIKYGAKDGALGDSVYKRLEAALIAFATVSALLQTTTSAQPDSVLTFPSFWASFAIMGLTVAIAWGGFGKTGYGLSLKRYGPLPILKKVQDDTVGLGNTAAGSSGLVAKLYAALTFAFAGAGASYLLLSEETLAGVLGGVQGAESLFLWRAIGGAVLTLVPAVAYSLKEAAENDDLGEAPYKVLNFGLAGAGALHLAVLLPTQLAGAGGFLTPVVLGTWVLATAVAGGNLLVSSRK
ncbi:hypothetical protein WJX81_004426 [Elliptochloris bilobata]|uniref:Uncharacterized protein n=1 Tax=Elliptochloris bilobata TaxID=381761 RepID=A0AAW1QTZ7_9CHLO